MKKKILAFVMAAATCFSLTACNTDNNSGSGSSGSGNSGAGNSNNESSSGDNTSNSGGGSSSGDTISLRVWGPEEDQSLLVELVDKFKAAYPNQTFDIQIGVESEATAKDTIITDVSAAADVFAFASDQVNSLIAANALTKLDDLNDAFKAVTGKSIDDIKAANSPSSVAEGTRDGGLYAFPLGSGNNYFLYYDKSKINDSDVATWDGLLSACSTAGKKAGMVFNSGWYAASFFIGAGFRTSMNADGTTVCDWNGTSSDGFTGTQVTQAMLNISNNDAFMAINDNDISNQIATGDLCAVVSGSWDLGACETIWGADNVGCAKLPTFTCDGKQVQQGCFTGYKLMGVNKMSQQTGWAAVLAEYLTNEESQVARYNARTLSPTNIVASKDEAVTSNHMIVASIAQDAACSVVQDVGDNFWAPCTTFGEIIAQRQLNADDTAGIQTALDNLVAGITAPIA
ncbi:MAG: extracellular solute-binding protein [Lachnospiraceae bacterium]|nr:extracellular solute-binding protein [Ruminococcus sp.]MCM1274759.1 extracellular solute-binding protein [Lachnospiraceae bacterium]